MDPGFLAIYTSPHPTWGDAYCPSPCSFGGKIFEDFNINILAIRFVSWIRPQSGTTAMLLPRLDIILLRLKLSSMESGFKGNIQRTLRSNDSMFCYGLVWKIIVYVLRYLYWYWFCLEDGDIITVISDLWILDPCKTRVICLLWCALWFLIWWLLCLKEIYWLVIQSTTILSENAQIPDYKWVEWAMAFPILIS